MIQGIPWKSLPSGICSTHKSKKRSKVNYNKICTKMTNIFHIFLIKLCIAVPISSKIHMGPIFTPSIYSDTTSRPKRSAEISIDAIDDFYHEYQDSDFQINEETKNDRFISNLSLFAKFLNFFSDLTNLSH